MYTCVWIHVYLRPECESFLEGLCVCRLGSFSLLPLASCNSLPVSEFVKMFKAGSTLVLSQRKLVCGFS